MGKCICCGSKGLLLKLDSQGRCLACLEKIEREELIKFNTYYSYITTCIKKQREDVDIGHDPVKALELIPTIQNRINECETLLTEISNPHFRTKLTERLINSVTYRDEFSKRHGMGVLEELGIHVYADSISKTFSGEKIISDIKKQIEDYKRRWLRLIIRIKNCAVYQEQIDEIEAVQVEFSDTKYNKLSIPELDELIKYSNVTAKTNFERLGNFVVIDTETTGLSAMRGDIVEIAAIRFVDWTPVMKFHTLINPGKHIPESASTIHNITDEMVADAPIFTQIIDHLTAFIGKFDIVGHNLPFDLKFLYRNGYDFTVQKRRYFDTCEIAKKTLKKPKMKWDKEYAEYIINENYDYDVENYKLTTLCEHYRIRDNLFAHRALSDAFATGCLFKLLAQDKIGS